jgi:phosphoglycolate phosphatase-like HAD superfamily hydrolase
LIKAVIFDFDGVIIESSDIKTEAFRELFQDYPQKIEAIIDYHLLNGGISRYVKFRYIYKCILREELSKEKENELGEAFSQIVFEKVLSAPFVAGAKEFFDGNKNRYQFFVVSGTPQEELYNIICIRGLQIYFKEIFGSPEGKADSIKSIIEKYGFDRDDVVYIGDAESDRHAAREAGLAFIERKADADTKSESNPRIIRDLINLANTLQKLKKE